MRTILIEASPWNASTGAAVPVALAGGGVRAYRHRARNDWKAGVVAEPRFGGRIDFDQDGFAGGARPSFAPLEFAPRNLADLATLSGYLWNMAPIEVFVGDDELPVPVWTTLIKGTVELQTVRGGKLYLKVRDVSADLDVAVASEYFLGTGGAEGDAVIAQRMKRRGFGRCSNVEALLFKESTLLFEVGDTSKPMQAIDDIKDMGRSGSSLAVVAWAGSIAATIAALEAQAVQPGGGAAAPSIALVKWWTRPQGPLTVDLRGEVGAGYVETTAELAARVIASRTAITVSNVAAGSGWRPGEAGIYFDNPGETISQGLDRLVRGSSLAWNAEANGTVALSQISLTGSVETVKAIDVARSQSFKPLSRRRVGYRRNHRKHSDSELSAAPSLSFLVSDTPPSAAASSPGQLWQDSSARYWQRREDIYLSIGGNRIMVGGNLLTMAFTPTANQPVRTSLDNALLEIDDIRALALDAQATADGKVDTFIQPSAPTGTVGDLWFDSDDGNKQYRFNGSTWELTQDQEIGEAILAAAGAQATADGKVTTFLSESAPTAQALGDLWLKQSTGELRRWSGAAWGDPIVDLTAAAQITVVAPPTVFIYRTYLGAVKPGQLPQTIRPLVTRGGTNITQDAATVYAVTGTGGLAGKVTVSNAGDGTRGDITIPNTVTGGGVIKITVTVSGIAIGEYTVEVITKDDLAPIDNGTAGGTDSSLPSLSTNSYVVMTNQDGDDPVLDVAITSGQTLRLSANFYYNTGSTAPRQVTCKGEYSADGGSTWLAMDGGEVDGSPAQRLTSPPEIVEGEMSALFTKGGLGTATYKVQLLGRVKSGAGTLVPTSGSAISSRA